jgi:hypothetical protein
MRVTKQTILLIFYTRLQMGHTQIFSAMWTFLLKKRVGVLNSEGIDSPSTILSKDLTKMHPSIDPVFLEPGSESESGLNRSPSPAAFLQSAQ